MAAEASSSKKKLVLVGNPNVGKSVIFRLLTGSYVLVSNFPGTTVEVTRGRMQLGGSTYEVVDTPGVNSLVPQSEDERVTCEILLREKPDIIVQVADAKNLRRTLLVTSQLVEFGIPMVLVLNMIDEAEKRGIENDSKGLSKFFSVSVVETIATYGRGKRRLLNAIQNANPPMDPIKTLYSKKEIIQFLDGLPVSPKLLTIEWLAEGNDSLNKTIGEVLARETMTQLEQLQERYRLAHRHALAKDIYSLRSRLLEEAFAAFKGKKQDYFVKESSDLNRLWLVLLIAGLILFAWNEIGGLFHVSTPFNLTMQTLAGKLNASAEANGSSLLRSLLIGENTVGHIEYGIIPELIHFLLVIAPVVVPLGILLARSRSFAGQLGALSRRISTGIPILFAVMLLLYEFVGYTGAQTLVGLLEKVLFGQHIVPFIQKLLPSGFFSELIVGDYGLVSMGIAYAIGIVLPVVGTFFIAFGLLEDSGYLPRLSVLSDRVMRVMGLNGKAILPMILGFGCCTMATMSTRILSSSKERLIAILLLALGIPCSAQLGVILGIAASFSSRATLTVIGVVAFQLLLVGYFSSQIIRGRPSDFIFEIPPIRIPQIKNVALKTWYRVQWYLKEAVPLFLYGTLVLFVLDKVQVFGRSLLVWIQALLEPLLAGILNLPSQTAGIFLLGFLRRDYGAAGLYEMTRNGILTGQQAVVSLIVLTLFVPCLATFLMIIKEQGLKRALYITAFIIPFAVSVGGVVSWILRTFDIQFN